MNYRAKAEKYLRPIRHMVQLQLASLFVVCLVILFALMYFIGGIEDDARYLKQAERQRTFASQVTDILYKQQFLGEYGVPDSITNKWVENQKKLESGTLLEGSNLKNNPVLDSIYNRIGVNQTRILDLLDRPSVSRSFLQDSIPLWESEYLAGMDYIVTTYQRQYEEDLLNFKTWANIGIVFLMVLGFLSYQYLLAPIYLKFREIFSKLQKSESQLIEAQEITNTGNWQWDIIMDEITWSDQLYKVFDQDKEEFNANYGNVMELIHPDDREAFNFDVERAIEEKADHDIIYRAILKNGEIRYLHQKGRAFYNEIGKPTRMVGTTIDVTEQMLAKQKIVNQNRELQNFIHVISHNLRRPVANILGLHDIYVRGKDKQNDEVMEHIRISCETLDTTIRDLNHSLSLRKLKSEEFEDVDMQDVVQDVFTLLIAEIESYEARLEVQLRANYFRGIKSYFVNILYNLILNALKYSAPERTPEILITSNESYSEYILEVSDNGKGIKLTPESRKKIFDMYGRLSGDSEGKGLGLYLVKTQVEAMDGQIAVSSVPGTGTRFEIRVPKSGVGRNDFDAMEPSFAGPYKHL